MVYKEEFETKLQERLTSPTLWKEVCKVTYTDIMVLHNPYLTDAVTFTGTRGTGYDSTPVATTDDTVSINTYVGSAQHIDRADLAQKTFTDWMEIADNMGIVLDEKLETAMLAEFAQLTTFDNNTLTGGAAGNITVTVSNVKNIITSIKRKIREAGGGTLANKNGIFIIWREADFELVEQVASASGYNVADNALENGIAQGFKFMGVEHYSSSKHTAGHVIAGVKKTFNAGICKSTYGFVQDIINPVVAGKQISGMGLESRVDHKFKAWFKVKPVLFDVRVA